jgi:8-oxo-dGTP diphosphatase
MIQAGPMTSWHVWSVLWSLVRVWCNCALIQLSANDYAHLAQASFDLCERKGASLLLNRDPTEVASVPRHGLHLNSRVLMGLSERPGRSNELVGASCHDQAQLARAAELGLDYALLSPIKPTASHPETSPLGWSTFAAWVDPAPLPVYALGGLTIDDLDDAFRHGAQGIAAIRGLWPQS